MTDFNQNFLSSHYVDCPYCNKTKCEKCNYTGYVKTVYKGKGQCWKCKGRGIANEQRHRGSHSLGTAETYYEDVKCTNCRGTGQEDYYGYPI